MKKFIEYIEYKYERLFSRRYKLENECEAPIKGAARRRFNNHGVIFPAEPLLPRYQY